MACAAAPCGAALAVGRCPRRVHGSSAPAGPGTGCPPSQLPPPSRYDTNHDGLISYAEFTQARRRCAAEEAQGSPRCAAQAWEAGGSQARLLQGSHPSLLVPRLVLHARGVADDAQHGQQSQGRRAGGAAALTWRRVPSGLHAIVPYLVTPVFIVDAHFIDYFAAHLRVCSPLVHTNLRSAAPGRLLAQVAASQPGESAQGGANCYAGGRGEQVGCLISEHRVGQPPPACAPALCSGPIPFCPSLVPPCSRGN